MPTLTLVFDDPFWVALLTVDEPDGSRLYRSIFGSEPTPPVLYLFLLHEWRSLVAGEGAMVATTSAPQKTNPKRRLREARKQTSEQIIAAEVTAALQAQRQAAKQERNHAQHEQHERETEQRWNQRRAKALAKRKGH